MKFFVPSLALAGLVLTGCTNSPPPPSQDAMSIVESLDVSDDVKTCMKKEISGFQVPATFSDKFASLDAAATAAAKGDAAAQQVVKQFETALEACAKK